MSPSGRCRRRYRAASGGPPRDRARPPARPSAGRIARPWPRPRSRARSSRTSTSPVGESRSRPHGAHARGATGRGTLVESVPEPSRDRPQQIAEHVLVVDMGHQQFLDQEAQIGPFPTFGLRRVTGQSEPRMKPSRRRRGCAVKVCQSSGSIVAADVLSRCAQSAASHRARNRADALRDGPPDRVRRPAAPG